MSQKAAILALRENPSWARQSKHWFRVALWAFRYSDVPPSRDDVAKALVAAQHSRPQGFASERLE